MTLSESQYYVLIHLIQNHTTQFSRLFRRFTNADELLHKLRRGLNYKENRLINSGERGWRNGAKLGGILGIEALRDTSHTLRIAAHIETSVWMP